METKALPKPCEARPGLSYIEHLFALSEKDICSTQNRAILRAIDEPTKSVYYIRPVCKRWSCPECGQRNRRFWTARTIHGFSELSSRGDELFFMTITSHERVREFDAGLRRWRKQWNSLYLQLKRRVPDLAYMRVFEHNKDHAFHAHLVINGQPLDKRWIKDAPRAKGFGYINEIEVLHSQFRAGFYVAKYVAKSLDDAEWPENVRRIQPSRSWPKLPSKTPDNTFSWQLVPYKTNIEGEIRRFRRRGYGVATF